MMWILSGHHLNQDKIGDYCIKCTVVCLLSVCQPVLSTVAKEQAS